MCDGRLHGAARQLIGGERTSARDVALVGADDRGTEARGLREEKTKAASEKEARAREKGDGTRPRWALRGLDVLECQKREEPTASAWPMRFLKKINKGSGNS